MLGNFDEYAGGATYKGYTTRGTLMSSDGMAGFEKYFWTVEHFTEVHSGLSLNTVLSKAATHGPEALTGTTGMDGFYGLGGDDTISGGAGNDLLDGGEGWDILTGGTGSDIFDYDFASEAALDNFFTGNPSRFETITDFRHLLDKIDLSGMDASSKLPGNNAFVWKGTAAFGPSPDGELRYQEFNNAGTTNDYTMLYGDTDDDAIFEFRIKLLGLIDLSSADFYL
jgi:Ca2+-binding RTX toxin-like protein